jgi:hypothetical protein
VNAMVRRSTILLLNDLNRKFECCCRDIVCRQKARAVHEARKRGHMGVQ